MKKREKRETKKRQTTDCVTRQTERVKTMNAKRISSDISSLAPLVPGLGHRFDRPYRHAEYQFYQRFHLTCQRARRLLFSTTQTRRPVRRLGSVSVSGKERARHYSYSRAAQLYQHFASV